LQELLAVAEYLLSDSSFGARLMRFLRASLAVVSASCLLTLGGCFPANGVVDSEPLTFNSLMKSDLNMLAEVHQQQTLGYLEELTGKLYRRNPRELHKVGGATIDSRRQQLFSPLSATEEIDEPDSGVAQLNQVFEEAYRGDRVFVLVAGLRDMVMTAYNNQYEFYLLGAQLDPQKFYNSARNVEILLWRLSRERQTNGQPWLLTNAVGVPVNLSYERLFGKLIAQLDMMALMVAHQRNMRIKNVVRRVATTVFLPV